jgi:hypothetical protein
MCWGNITPEQSAPSIGCDDAILDSRLSIKHSRLTIAVIGKCHGYRTAEAGFASSITCDFHFNYNIFAN